MDTKLVTIVDVIPLSSPLEINWNNVEAEDSRGHYWKTVYLGILENANLFIKYQGRLLIDGTGRQEVFLTSLIPQVGADSFHELKLAAKAEQDLAALCAKIAGEIDQHPRSGLIVEMQVDHNQIGLGSVETDAIASLIGNIARQLPNLDKFNLAGCRIDNPKGEPVNLTPDILEKVEDLKRHIVAAAYPSVFYMDRAQIPGRTLVVDGTLKGPYKTYWYRPPGEKKWVAGDVWRYTDNRKKRKPKDASAIVDSDLERILQKKPNKKNPTESIPGVKVILKTHEKIYLDATENGQRPGRVFEVSATGLIGTNLEDIKEGDRLDLWVLAQNRPEYCHIKRKADTYIILEEGNRKLSVAELNLPADEFAKLQEGQLTEVSNEISHIRVTPFSRFSAIDVQTSIKQEQERVTSLDYLQSRIDSLERRFDKLPIMLPEQIRAVDKAAQQRQQNALDKFQQQFDAAETDLAQLQGMAQQPQQSASDKKFGIAQLRKKLDSLEEALKTEEAHAHKQVYERLCTVRKPQDESMVALGNLIVMLNVHQYDTGSNITEDELNVIREPIDKLLARYRVYQDAVNKLEDKKSLDKDDALAIEQLTTLLPQELQSQEKPPEIIEMEVATLRFIYEKQSQQFAVVEKIIQEGEPLLAELQAAAENTPDYMREEINQWLSQVRSTWNAELNGIERQRKGLAVLNSQPDVNSRPNKRMLRNIEIDWVARQRLIHYVPLQMRMINQRIEAFTEHLITQEQREQELDDKQTTLTAQLQKEDFSAQFLDWADRMQKASSPITHLAVKNRLIDLMEAIAEDKELGKKIEKVLSESRDQSIDMLESTVIEHRLMGLSAGRILEIGESQFALQALRNWVITHADDPEDLTSDYIADETERLRQALAAKRPELRLPVYASDHGIDLIDAERANAAELHIKNLRNGNKDELDRVSTSKEITETYDQTFNEFLYDFKIVRTYLQGKHPNAVKDVFGRIDKAFEKQRAQLPGYGLEWVTSQANSEETVDREKRSGVLQLLTHFGDIERSAAQSDALQIKIDTELVVLSEEEKKQWDEEESQDLAEQERRKTAEDNWNKRKKSQEEKLVEKSLTDRRKWLSNELGQLSHIEREFVEVSVKLGLLSRSLEARQSQSTTQSSQGSKLPEEVSVGNRRQAGLNQYIQYLTERLDDGRAQEGTEQLIRDLCNLHDDEIKIWEGDKNKPSLAQLNEKAEQVRQEYAKKMNAWRGELEELHGALRNIFWGAVDSNALERELPRFQRDLSHAKNAVPSEAQLKKLNLTEQTRKLGELDSKLKSLQENWNDVVETLSQRSLQRGLESAAAWVRRQLICLENVSASQATFPSMQELVALGNQLHQSATLLQKKQPANVIKDVTRLLQKFTDEQKSGLADQLQAYFVQQIALLVMRNQHVAGELEDWKRQNKFDPLKQAEPVALLERHANAWNKVMELLDATTKLLTSYQSVPQEFKDRATLDLIIDQGVKLGEYQKALQTLRTQGISQWNNTLTSKIEPPKQLPQTESTITGLQQRQQMMTNLLQIHGNITRDLDALNNLVTTRPILSGKAQTKLTAWQARRSEIGDELRQVFTAPANDLPRIQGVIDRENTESEERRRFLETMANLSRWLGSSGPSGDDDDDHHQPPPPSDGKDRSKPEDGASRSESKFNARLKSVIGSIKNPRKKSRGATKDSVKDMLDSAYRMVVLSEWIKKNTSKADMVIIDQFEARPVAADDHLGSPVRVLGDGTAYVVKLAKVDQYAGGRGGALHVIVPAELFKQLGMLRDMPNGKNSSNQNGAAVVTSMPTVIRSFTVKADLLDKVIDTLEKKELSQKAAQTILQTTKRKTSVSHG